jgi:PAS domain S-box-containing protein
MAALEISERRLRIAVELSRLSVYEWDPVAGTLNWDARLKAMWGLPPDAVVNFAVFAQGVHPDDRDYVLKRCAHAIDPGGDGRYEAEFRVIGLTDGVERWVIARGQTFFENDKPVGYVGGAMDITERKRAEERLEKKVAERTAQLEASNAQLEDYVYTIAHDLRAPLRSMQSFSKLLLEEYAARLDETAQGYAQRIVRAAGTLDTMVTDLLAYSRVMRAEMALGPVDLLEAWSAAAAQHEQAIKEPRAMIETSPALAGTTVRAHAATLVQVFANLLSNAIKFVPAGVAPFIRVWTETTNDRVRVWISDNGIGIAPEYHEKIFRVFERLHGKAYSGTGVGLAIVQTGIRRMAGDVGLTSSPGEGAKFWIELPLFSDRNDATG